MTVSETISLFTSVGSCLAATAAFLTILQTKKQQKASYRPELVLISTAIRLDWGESISWIVESSAGEKKGGGISLCNIGLGTAKNIKVKWELSCSEMREFIEQLNSFAPAGETFVLSKNTLSVKQQKGEKLVMLGHRLCHELEYVLPLSDQKIDTILPIPYAYMSIISIIYNLRSVSKDFGEAMPEMPLVKITAEYSDIANNIAINRYYCSYEESEYRFNAREAIGSANGVLKFCSHSKIHKIVS